MRSSRRRSGWSARPRSRRRRRTSFRFVNDFRRWIAWSPWEKLDAELKRNYGGAESGKGATYGWQGKKAGTGRMEIIEAEADSKILIKLDFLKPFEAHNTAEFTFTPQVDGTRVDWAMYRPEHLHGQADEHLHQYRQAGRQGLRERPRCAEGCSREIAGAHEGRQPCLHAPALRALSRAARLGRLFLRDPRLRAMIPLRI